MTTSVEYDIMKELMERELEQRKKATSSLLHFTEYTMPSYKTTWYHIIYSKILDQFAKGNMRKLMITMPPQHGKSELSTRRLPAFMLGQNNKKRVCISSYNATKVREFSKDVQRIIADPLYFNLFPQSLISNSEPTRNLHLQHIDAQRTLDRFEIFEQNGFKRGDLRAVGRGGALTGNPVDVKIMDDLYKDYKEGNSPKIRLAVIDWYVSVVRTRFHNLSQELIVFTRWHEEDLIGYLEKTEDVELIHSLEQILNPDPNKWYKINFEALKTNNASELDTREIGGALWEEMHSKEKLLNFRKLDAEKFESLYQGDPQPMVGLLYQKGFKTYGKKPEYFRYIYNYTDTADRGNDYLCSINYGVGLDDNIYILDVVYTDAPQEETEKEVADLVKRGWVNTAVIESNNGGRAFARNVDRISGYRLAIEWFHQSDNKEARIISNSADLQRCIYFPERWQEMWPEFSKALLRFKRNFSANTHDDAADTLTGVWEHSGLADNNFALWG